MFEPNKQLPNPGYVVLMDWFYSSYEHTGICRYTLSRYIESLNIGDA